MELKRDIAPRHKQVLVINDVPVKAEIESGHKWSAISNINLLGALRTGKINPYATKFNPNHKGILPLQVHGTYLTYSYYFEEKNFDFRKDFAKHKDLELLSVEEFENDETIQTYTQQSNLSAFLIKKDWKQEDSLEKPTIENTFYKLEHQKDCYVSFRLWKELQELKAEILSVNPSLVIITGKWALFLLTGCCTLAANTSTPTQPKPLGCIMKFRGSLMSFHKDIIDHPAVVYPIIHTVNAIGMPDKAPYLQADVERAGRIFHDIREHGIEYYKKDYVQYCIPKTIEEARTYIQEIIAELDKGPRLLVGDIETFFSRIIDCCGFALSKDKGYCFPFAAKGVPHIWTLEEETEIMEGLRAILEHPNAQHVGQNYNYDCQYYYRVWSIPVLATWDTMGLQHTLYSFTPKDLAFLASIYCKFYSYWKDAVTALEETPETRWFYNIKDNCYTYEIVEILIALLAQHPQKLQDLYRFQQDELNPLLLHRMVHGVRIDEQEKARLYGIFSELLVKVRQDINDLLGMEFNPESTPQRQKLFKDFLGIELKLKQVKGQEARETTDAAAMLQYIEEYPLYRPFLTLLLEYNSLKVFTRTFLGMELDAYGRGHTNYNLFGPYTGRLSSSKDAFGQGANFQNIPEKGKISLNYVSEIAEEGYAEDTLLEGLLALPNVKEIFLPDYGKEILDCDLSGADIQIVAADSNCKWLQEYFLAPRGNGKVYHYIASDFFQKEISADEYKTYKSIFHGTNYKMGIKKLAQMAGISEFLAEKLQKFYFSLCPEIQIWHKQLETDISAGGKGYIENIYGRRAYFLNANDPMRMNKVCAFIPQSTIAHVINLGIVQTLLHITGTKSIKEFLQKMQEIELLLQVHDSGVFQYCLAMAEAYRVAIKEKMVVDIPYTPTLRIPVDIKYSNKSYGDCKK